MPSCSSNLSILRENEFNDTLKRFSCYCEKILHIHIDAETLGEPLWCFIKTVTYLKVFWWSFKRDIFTVFKVCLFQSCLVLNHISLIGQIIKCIQIHLNLSLTVFIKCEELEFQNIFKIVNFLNVLELNYQNVIWLIESYILLQVLSYFILLNHLKLQSGFLIKLNQSFYNFSCLSCGNIATIVMEVVEASKEIGSFVTNLPNGDKSDELGSFEKKNLDDVCFTVIKENQIMKVSEYSHLKSIVMNDNNIDVDIKEENRQDSNNESILNGDPITNCHINCNDLKYKKADFNQMTETEVKIDLKVKDEPDSSSNDVSVNTLNCEFKENANYFNKNLECKNEEKVKSEAISNDSDSGKNKIKVGEICLNNNVNHISSSSSSSSSSSPSKKHRSQSHQSSHHKYKDDRHKNSSSSSTSSSGKNNESSSDRTKGDGRSKTSSGSKSRNCHHKSDEKCHCKSRHRSHHHSRKSKKYQSVKTQCTADEIAFELRQNRIDPSNPYFTRVPWVPHPQLVNLKYGRFYRIEEDRNGGATVCHLYMDEINHLTETQMKECAIEFIKLSYSEDENECAYHVMGIVHGAASYLPDLVDYMADHYPTLIVKTGSLASRDNHTTTMSQYRDEVYKTYSNGTFRYAPLDQLSICGVLGEEVGAYFPDFVARLEQSPFMKPVMPWSFLSVVQTDNPRESNDGPIFWVRPGEQMLPANEALKESSRPKKRRNNELDNLAYIGGSRFSEARESLFMDRTKAHADQVGVDYGLSNTAPTAAVGVLKAVNCGHPEHGNRATKDVVAFHAQDYNELLEILMLDLYEPPQTQCTKWIEVSKLNTLRREGIRYAHLQLHDNDVYYLPRKIIHQFQTISSVASVAWHIRYRDYFSIMGAPNLHTPTGINKGQVFYEKKNVAVYCPPVCENDLLSAVVNLESGLKTPKKSDRLREYSPFKHSPRKTHKYQSPRSATKKEKQSESVPLPPNTVVKSDTETSVNDQEKRHVHSTKKRERSKSSEEAKKESEDDDRKVSEKGENSHNRRSSGDHSASKKERNQNGHSTHRKEVKNLKSEFSLVKDKLRRDKSPKSKSEKSSVLRDDKNSKQRRHNKSTKLRSSNGSSGNTNGRHDKTEHEQDKAREHVSNDQTTHRIKTDENGEANLKRKHGDLTGHAPVKRNRQENPRQEISENGKESPLHESEKFPENKPPCQGDNPDSAKRESDSSCETIKEEKTRYESANEHLAVNEKVNNDSREAVPDVKFVNIETDFQTDCACDSMNIDLRQNMPFAGYLAQVPPFPLSHLPPPPPPPPLPPPPPPLPASSPINPPLPPPSSTSQFLENSLGLHSPQKEIQSNNLQAKGELHVKKVKKKSVKKNNDSYDLLGNIMSEMDKKKL